MEAKGRLLGNLFQEDGRWSKVSEGDRAKWSESLQESQGGRIKPTPDICRAWEMQMAPGSQPAPPPFFSHFQLVLQSEGLLLMECMHIPTINPSSVRALHLQTAARNCPSGPGHTHPSCFTLKRTNRGRKSLQALEVGLELFGQRCPTIGYLERGLEDKSRALGVGVGMLFGLMNSLFCQGLWLSGSKGHFADNYGSPKKRFPPMSHSPGRLSEQD